MLETCAMATAQVADCPDCSGTGQMTTACSSCGGDGRVRRTKKISLRVPPGVDSGSRLRVRGEGNAGRRGGEQGDLYVFVGVREDKGASSKTAWKPCIVFVNARLPCILACRDIPQY